MRAAPTITTHEQYIASLPADRREPVRQIAELIRKAVPKLKPCVTGGMLGFGPFHYRYASGREGDTALVALASQKNYLSLYVCACDAGGYVAEKYRGQLPKAKIGKSCVRFKRVEDLDLIVIRQMLKDAERAGGMGACQPT